MKMTNSSWTAHKAMKLIARADTWAQAHPRWWWAIGYLFAASGPLFGTWIAAELGAFQR